MVFLLNIDCDPPALWSSGNAHGGSHGSRVPYFWATPMDMQLTQVPASYGQCVLWAVHIMADHQGQSPSLALLTGCSSV